VAQRIGTIAEADEARIAAFERDGYVVVEDALAPREVVELAAAVDDVWHRRRPTEAERSSPLHLLAFLGEDPRFVELVDHPATLPLIARILGFNIHCYHCHLDVTPPADHLGPPTWEWHQDGTGQNTDLEVPRPRLSVKVAYFLSDVSAPGAGNLRVIPGSHRRDTLRRPSDGGVDPPGAISLCVRPGTAVLFDRRLWHSRSVNRSSRTRRALFYAYTYRWIRPRDEPSLSPDAIASLTPVRAQLLGVSTRTIGYWLPRPDEIPLRDWFEKRTPSSAPARSR
jgi:ectoine hydroxylase